MKQPKWNNIFAIASLMFLLPACYYDKEDMVYPTGGGGTCDTVAMKYSVDVVNILSTYCYKCHGGTAALGGGFVFDNYTGIKSMVNNGKLLKAINHQPGASAMPKGDPKLSDCNIAKITAWVNNGAPNN
jgi:putative hemolysin